VFVLAEKGGGGGGGGLVGGWGGGGGGGRRKIWNVRAEICWLGIASNALWMYLDMFL
jgi:hypothetical protein